MNSEPKILGESVRTYILDRVREEERGYSNPCWIWQLSLNHGGYPQGKPPGYPIMKRLPRAIYEAFVGPIPDGLEIDHLCRVAACCNPEHLEPVTRAENMRRRNWKRTTTCLHGHPFEGDNIKVLANGARTCRTCLRASWNRANKRRIATTSGASF